MMKQNLSTFALNTLREIPKETARRLRDFIRGELSIPRETPHPDSIPINDSGRRYVERHGYAIVYRVSDGCLFIDQIWPQ